MRNLGVPLETITAEAVASVSCQGQRPVLCTHLGPHVLETGRADERETDEEDIRLGVRERPKTVVILLTGRVPL